MYDNAQKFLTTVSGEFASKELWFSICWKLRYEKGGATFPGRAFKDIPRAVSFAGFMARQGFDVYLGQGGQRDVTNPKKLGSHPIAIRQRHNTELCSALYVDVDVKKDGGYDSQRNALVATKNFMVKYKLPPMTMLVSSGSGGLHGYWVMEELFSVEVFDELAPIIVAMGHEFGLKFDPQCTSNPCCLLRVPDTWNFKSDPANPVEILYSGSKLPLSLMKERLHGFNGTPQRHVKSNIDLQPRTFDPVDIDTVAVFCPMVQAALASGGANLQGEPQWHGMAALSAHCTNGEATLHRLCEKHRYYNHDDTTIKYYEAVKAREHNPKLGPPKCGYFQRLGVDHCNTCQYLSLDTTPLLVPIKAYQPKITSGVGHNSDLPSGYYRNKEHHILAELSDKESGEQITIEVFPYAMMYGTIYAEGSMTGYQLVFTTIEGGNREKVIKVPMHMIAEKPSLTGVLGRQGLPAIVTEPMRKFMVTLMQHNRSSDKTLVINNPLGWCKMPDGITGFSYDGTCYLPQTSVRARKLEGDFEKHYTVEGTDQAWITLSSKIIAQNRVDINVIIACAFAAPLIELTGHNGMAIGIYGPRSGVGKSTALAINQAVWGSTIRMGGLDDTINQVVDTMATLRNLPFNWDELKGKKQIEQMAQVFFLLTRGREKGRLDQHAKQKQQREFETFLVWTSNQPLVGIVASATRGTGAGRYRLLEFKANENFISDLNITEITNLTGELRKNHGHIGRIYSKFLGENYEQIKKLILGVRQKFEDEVKGNQTERFLISAATCIYVGAQFANKLGITKFDIQAIKDFLFQQINNVRNYSEVTGQAADLSRSDDTEGQLGEFLYKYSDRFIKTDQINLKPGRPTKVKIINDSVALGYKTIVAQIDQTTLTLRVADTTVGEWCKETELPKEAFTTALIEHLGAKKSKGRIGAGTEKTTSLIDVWTIPLAGTELGKAMEF